MIRVNHYETMSKSVKRHAKNTVDFFSDADYSNDYTNGRQLHKDVNSTEALEAIHSQYHIHHQYLIRFNALINTMYHQ